MRAGEVDLVDTHSVVSFIVTVVGDQVIYSFHKIRYSNKTFNMGLY